MTAKALVDPEMPREPAVDRRTGRGRRRKGRADQRGACRGDHGVPHHVSRPHGRRGSHGLPSKVSARRSSPKSTGSSGCWGLPRSSLPSSPKRRSPATANRVRSVLRSADAPLSAQNVTLQASLSRQTTQLYLNLLERAGPFRLTLSYGETGRPKQRYEWEPSLPPTVPTGESERYGDESLEQDRRQSPVVAEHRSPFWEAALRRTARFTAHPPHSPVSPVPPIHRTLPVAQSR